ncbi:NADH-quinone oxidoreductase subunit L [Vallicoccus soli]|uniref:NADH-quinone oxidoreductase subunit L n=1 Tax=Vallicoccus soli TaxID=2339232 RepID=A0A3A3ZEQ6_9ACTN|nr:NADH-quinone oxidoreductase subunit L [Vallicoccus soli]
MLAAEPVVTAAGPATGVFDLVWLLAALPAAGAALLLLGGRRTDRWGHLLATGASAASFVLAVLMFVAMLGRDAEERVVRQVAYTWIPSVGDFSVDAAFRLDPLSMAFVLLVTGVGTLIHVYSIGYMAHDPDRRRFFAYLNLFVAAMLVLVLADDYLVLYLGWEGVGLASYLLIGFWGYNPAYATAARKAFVVNRVGDVGLSIALMTMFATFGTLSFSGVLGAADGASETTLTVIGLLLLLAACGKSAQVPLQSWLGDAMAGPTPVSALIHAATMVTAGVYLIVRSGPIFDLAPDARLAVVVVGAVTLLFGAVIGCAKDDIKKALAASTMSQIGYMVLAAGLGPAGYAFAIAHLLTHGFFKAGMFLGAGSVMHAMDDQTDMRRFGGLYRALPVTHATFVLGWLAIIGIPPFAGFWTKDAIIEAALAEEGWRAYVFGGAALLGAGLTAFYMTRLMVMTFWGKRRWTQGQHPHEAPSTMTGPMVVLAAGSALAGLLLIPGERLVHWLEPVVPHSEHELPVPVWVISLMTVAVVLVGVALAVAQYARGRDIPLTAPVAVSPFTAAARRDLYQDAVNEAVLMRPGQYLTRTLVWGDNRGIDGLVNTVAATIGGTSGRLRRLQTGFVRSYALSMLGGAALVVGALLIVRL